MEGGSGRLTKLPWGLASWPTARFIPRVGEKSRRKMCIYENLPGMEIHNEEAIGVSGGGEGRGSGRAEGKGKAVGEAQAAPHPLPGGWGGEGRGARERPSAGVPVVTCQTSWTILDLAVGSGKRHDRNCE